MARAAVAIADADGLDAVTFRAIAARLGTGVMSLYNYVPDKQALVYDMTELVAPSSTCPSRPATGGPTCTWWRAGSAISRSVTPGWSTAVSHLQPIGPATLALLEFALGALEPTGLSAATASRRSPWSTGSC